MKPKRKLTKNQIMWEKCQKAIGRKWMMAHDLYVMVGLQCAYKIVRRYARKAK